jgi:hypothetical protein
MIPIVLAGISGEHFVFKSSSLKMFEDSGMFSEYPQCTFKNVSAHNNLIASQIILSFFPVITQWGHNSWLYRVNGTVLTHDIRTCLLCMKERYQNNNQA